MNTLERLMGNMKVIVIFFALAFGCGIVAGNAMAFVTKNPIPGVMCAFTFAFCGGLLAQIEKAGKP